MFGVQDDCIDVSSS